jgi:hypothetical protein
MQERAATLTLSIPPDFARVTFHDEFYGRRFTVIDGRLVTDVPWTPGERELAFTYVIPRAGAARVWRRSVDLPTLDMQVSLRNDTSEDDLRKLSRDAEVGHVLFASKRLDAGAVIEVAVGNASVPIMVYLRWGTLFVLAGGAFVTLWSSRFLTRRERLRHTRE